MKQIRFILVYVLVLCCGMGSALAADAVTIPYPNSIQQADGFFVADKSETALLNPLTLSDEWKKGARFNYNVDASIPEEGYELAITPSAISIKSSTEAGFFYALQTIQQMMIAEGDTYKVPAATIKDAPRFRYRGMHLDVSRSFKDKDYVLKQLDAMARYKLNCFHWHLTDDPGWRIEIKKYPLLTEKTAYKPYSNYNEWLNGGRRFCAPSDPNANGGFYTQEDVKEVVAYAKARHITIIPEIEQPGHAFSAIYAYPELSCSGKAQNSEFCIGNDKVFEFYENVMLEILELFPSEFIHIGGDEVWQGVWQTCPKCQARMKNENLGDVYELQSYTITRVENFLEQHGRHIIGWDEILLGGLAPRATVMSWQEEVGGIEAAFACHDVIMTPGGYCYLDNYQDAPHTQPQALGGYIPLEKVYSYNPVPDTLPPALHKYILGVQGNVWTELMPTQDHSEYMTYPRLLGIAEIGWTNLDQKDYTRFRAKAVEEVRYLESRGYNPFKLYNEVGTRQEARNPVNHLALGKPVRYNTQYADNYVAAGQLNMTNGLLGDWSYNDGRWQGFSGVNIDFVVDMQAETAISSLSSEFMQMTISGVYMPQYVEYSVSNDGVNFRTIGVVNNDLPQEVGTLTFKKFVWSGSENARYIRINAVNAKPASGWLFTDELIVN